MKRSISRFRLVLVFSILAAMTACQSSGGGSSSKTTFGSKITLSERYTVRQSSFSGDEDLKGFSKTERRDRTGGNIFSEFYFQNGRQTVSIEHSILAFFSDNSTDVVTSEERFREYLTGSKRLGMLNHVRKLKLSNGIGHFADDGTCVSAIFAKRLKPLTGYDNDRSQTDTLITMFTCSGINGSMEDYLSNFDLRS
jgi:hypothetical protein